MTLILTISHVTQLSFECFTIFLFCLFSVSQKCFFFQDRRLFPAPPYFFVHIVILLFLSVM